MFQNPRPPWGSTCERWQISNCFRGLDLALTGHHAITLAQGWKSEVNNVPLLPSPTHTCTHPIANTANNTNTVSSMWTGSLSIWYGGYYTVSVCKYLLNQWIHHCALPHWTQGLLRVLSTAVEFQADHHQLSRGDTQIEDYLPSLDN